MSVHDIQPTSSQPHNAHDATPDAATQTMASVFLPPVIRSAGPLNRALFTKRLPLAAARINDVKNIARYRKALTASRELLLVDRLSAVVEDPTPAAPEPGAAAGGARKKCLLLKHGTLATIPETWGAVVREGVEKKELGVVPYELELDYDHWTSREILASVLPEEFHDDVPTSFNKAGHVAHLNLRERFEPYKKLVAEVLLDKNPAIKTVINKTDFVGSESAFRTFGYEVLAGTPDLDVEVRENGCIFSFNYAKVYWNSKLESEHTRLVSLFRPGEVVVDVMAGIGPFAVPAGKKGVFVWANDMNPESFHCLEASVAKNKASEFVRPFNEDGRTFIRKAADSVLAAAEAGEYAEIRPKTFQAREGRPPPEVRRVPVPATVAHFVMNLPASAIDFLPCFQGLYAGREALFAPHTATKLPLLHVHCFAGKQDEQMPKQDVLARVSRELGVDMTLGDDPERDSELAVYYVREVSNNKSMYCATFRLPPQVAFAGR